jgi:hypothetical protein
MKPTVVLVALTLVLASCKSNVFYQIYKAEPTVALAEVNGVFQYEDDQCVITYDLWADGGNVGFRFFNKTDQNIYVNLEETFFIRNGTAFNYYKNRVFSQSSSTGSTETLDATKAKYVEDLDNVQLQKTTRRTRRQSVEIVNSSETGVTYAEEKVVVIPGKASKVFQEHLAANTLYRDCDLKKYPKGKKEDKKTFTAETSPLVFSNRIVYITGNDGKRKQVENGFYVSEISNISEKGATEMRREEFCDQKSKIKTRQFKAPAPVKFYYRYAKNRDYWKH